MEIKRIPLLEESISDQRSVAEYDCYAAMYMRPEYKYFIRKIVHQGIRRGRVLDIGTGSGRLAIELAKTKGCNYEIVAVDLSENMLRRAEKNAKKERVEDKIQFLLSSPQHVFGKVYSHNFIIAAFSSGQFYSKPSTSCSNI